LSLLSCWLSYIFLNLSISDHFLLIKHRSRMSKLKFVSKQIISVLNTAVWIYRSMWYICKSIPSICIQKKIEIKILTDSQWNSNIGAMFNIFHLTARLQPILYYSWMFLLLYFLFKNKKKSTYIHPYKNLYVTICSRSFACMNKFAFKNITNNWKRQ
jgi:hypothetical protein